MRCSKCGAEIRGVAVLCETCGTGPEQPVEQPRALGENVARGIVGALAGGAIGAAVIIGLSQLGIYAAIGGFVLAWRLIVAAWYVPLTVYRLIVG